jgi:enoyl-CoA hydratase/carnithine racemase
LDKRIRIKKNGRAGRLTIAINTAAQSFDVDTFQSLKRTLSAWARDESVEFVLIDRAASSLDFCASAGARTLSAAACRVETYPIKYLEAYLQLCYMIATYPKPVISILDGATMAEGTGLSLLGTHQVVTERASLSYPETSFGSVPCAGSTYSLASLAGEIGTWLALTGSRLAGSDICAAGLASNFCPSAELPDLYASLQKDGMIALERFETHRQFSLQKHRAEIDFAFSGACAKQIRHRLENGSDWSKAQATRMCAKSPLSTAVTLRLMRTVQFLDTPKGAFMLEFRALSKLVTSRNFREGVRAAYEDKDHWPDWRPKSVFNVTYDMVSEHFTPLYDRELVLIDLSALASPNPLLFKRDWMGLSAESEP